jgi:hypothetical protein
MIVPRKVLLGEINSYGSILFIKLARHEPLAFVSLVLSVILLSSLLTDMRMVLSMANFLPLQRVVHSITL